MFWNEDGMECMKIWLLTYSHVNNANCSFISPCVIVVKPLSCFTTKVKSTE